MPQRSGLHSRRFESKRCAGSRFTPHTPQRDTTVTRPCRHRTAGRQAAAQGASSSAWRREGSERLGSVLSRRGPATAALPRRDNERGHICHSTSKSNTPTRTPLYFFYCLMNPVIRAFRTVDTETRQTARATSRTRTALIVLLCKLRVTCRAAPLHHRL